MKKFLFALFSIVMLNACDINIYNDDPDDPNNETNLETPSPEAVFERADLYGTWKITHAKFDEGAVMTEWEYEDTYATFKENGIYEGEGHWGNGEGTYSIEFNTITTFIDMTPYIEYEVLSLNENTAEIKATFMTTKQKVWIKCEKVEELNEEPSITYPSDNFYADENSAKAALSAAYGHLRTFELYQHYIEYNAINNERSVLSVTSPLIYETWAKAYLAINYSNNIIKGLNSIEGQGWTASYNSHARAIRAFVYYNIAVLWGDVPYLDETYDAMQNPYPARTDKVAVLDNEIASLTSSMNDLEDLANGVTDFSKDAINILLAEMNLLKNAPTSAKTHLGCIDESSYNTTPAFCLSLEDINSGLTSPDDYFNNYKDLIWGSDLECINIYLGSTINLYASEANNDTDDILAQWSEHPQYGYWAALNRMGKAQEVTGCLAHELLMPIPDNELRNNLNMTQNAGY